MNSPHKVQWRRALMFSLICAWMNGWVINGGARDLTRHRAMTSLLRYVIQPIAYGHPTKLMTRRQESEGNNIIYAIILRGRPVIWD